MYCKNCGVELANKATQCEHCKTAVEEGHAFCPHCGAKTLPEQVLCLACGCMIKPLREAVPTVTEAKNDHFPKNNELEAKEIQIGPIQEEKREASPPQKPNYAQHSANVRKIVKMNLALHAIIILLCLSFLFIPIFEASFSADFLLSMDEYASSTEEAISGNPFIISLDQKLEKKFYRDNDLEASFATIAELLKNGKISVAFSLWDDISILFKTSRMGQDFVAMWLTVYALALVGYSAYILIRSFLNLMNTWTAFQNIEKATILKFEQLRKRGYADNDNQEKDVRGNYILQLYGAVFVHFMIFLLLGYNMTYIYIYHISNVSPYALLIIAFTIAYICLHFIIKREEDKLLVTIAKQEYDVSDNEK